MGTNTANTDLSFRHAKASDIPVLNQISAASKAYWGYPEEWLQRWQPDLMVNAEHLTENTVFVIQVGDRLIGFCSIAEEASFYEVLHLWVLPEFIGKGMGKSLLQHSLKQTVKLPKMIRVEADPNAAPFYESQGFETFDRVESYPKGRFLPVMRKFVQTNQMSQ
ncbi:MAG: GNAT family N-acetyltransferase [Bacteroidota bacterium]